MSLLESGENYLETILMLLKTQSDVHAIDIATHLGFSKPSVSIALKKLSSDEYITIDNSSHIHLTEKGEKIATKIYERHVLLTNAFKALGVDPTIAEEDACKIEHDLSDETFNAIKKHYNKLSNE